MFQWNMEFLTRRVDVPRGTSVPPNLTELDVPRGTSRPMSQWSSRGTMTRGAKLDGTMICDLFLSRTCQSASDCSTWNIGEAGTGEPDRGWMFHVEHPSS